ncbi:MAG: PIG-L family deacetylase [Methanomassiliicoccales archaeon]|nr:PIG-L family deacetylase [Methanomassiliicoccales archaeon]
MTMDTTSVKLELKLIYTKIAKRVGVGKSLAQSSWNPKFVDVPPGKRMLVLSPHPDDDAIGLGGTIIKLRERGLEVRVVYLSLPEDEVHTHVERKKEALEALETMGVGDYSIPEGGFPEPGLLRDLIIKELKDYHPDLVFVPSPLENHNQHLATFSAYLEALKYVSDVDTALFEVWGMTVPNMAVDITLQAERKAKAISAHTSQTKLVDYITMSKALNQYRAISCGHPGQAEVFLWLDRKEMLKLFNGR